MAVKIVKLRDNITYQLVNITLPHPVKVRALATSNIINMKKACIVYHVS